MKTNIKKMLSSKNKNLKVMKKILSVLIIALFSVTASAQIQGFTLGPKVGANFSRFSAEPDQIESEIRSSLSFGVFTRFGNTLYLQPELMFLNRKGEISSTEFAGSSSSIHLKTVDLPVMVGVRVMDAKLFNIRVMAGPVASVVVNKEINSSNWESAISKKEIRNANFGIHVGAGADVLMFTVDLRYEFGISDYSKQEGLSLKNNMFVVGLGWRIL